MKRSLALIGTKREAPKGLIDRLAKHFRLILVSQPEGHGIDETIHDVRNDEITIQSCAKEGCWEADIIFLMNDGIDDLSQLNAIKEVSTQKVVVGWSDTMKGFSTSQGLTVLKQLLPHSKLLWGYIDHTKGQVFIKGDDREALQAIQGVVGAMGYGSASVENS